MALKSLIVVAKNQIEWHHADPVSLKSGEIRTRNRYGTEKHGTMKAIVQAYGDRRGKMDEELGIYFGDGVAWNYPLSLGNMNFGEVIEVAEDVKDFAVGMTVATSAPFQQESVVSTQNAFLVPEGVSWKTAFLQDPGEFAMGALRDGQVRIGDCVAIFSLGAIGLTTVQMAKAAGASCVIGIDPVPARREAALNCGADVVLGDDPNDIGWQIRQSSRRSGIDVVIDFSGVPAIMKDAFRALAPLGNLVLGAYPDETQATIDFGRESHHNQLNIIFTRACSVPLRDHPRWDWQRIREATWKTICSGKLDGSATVDDPVPFDELLTAYQAVVANPSQSIKLSVDYGA